MSVGEKDKFAKHCGIELIEAGSGYAKAKMQIQPFHFNGVGIVQGGAIFTLADLAFAAASNSHDHVAVAINTNMSFIKATESGTLYAEAKEINPRGRVGSYSVTVTNDQQEIIAVFEGLAYRKF
jgi:acyl-CoA thioesterase